MRLRAARRRVDDAPLADDADGRLQHEEDLTYEAVAPYGEVLA